MQVMQSRREKDDTTRAYRVETSHGSLAVEECASGEIPLLMMAFKEQLSPAEVDTYVQGTVGESAESFMRKAVARTDGRFRNTLFVSLGVSSGPTQRQIVESSPTPIAVVNGDAEPIVNVDYVETVRFANLWQNHCYRLAGLGHAPFWENPGEFNPLLDRFLADVESGRASARSAAETTAAFTPSCTP
jgi:pimeloyl-ACP methyl ester carboxylesterase